MRFLNLVKESMLNGIKYFVINKHHQTTFILKVIKWYFKILSDINTKYKIWDFIILPCNVFYLSNTNFK